MKLLKFLSLPRSETEEMLLSTSRKIIITSAAIYLGIHFIATLFWTAIFSPRLWLVTLIMLVTLILSLRVLPRNQTLGKGLWFTGLSAAVLTAYQLFAAPEILLLFAVFPMMAEVMLGMRGTLIISGILLVVIYFLPVIPFQQPVESQYRLVLLITTLAGGVFGWALSDNLISANETANYHYYEALKRLEETRRHRAEISVLLKEQSKSNYQLDRLNKMLTIARARAEEARIDRDRFALAVSHELRSPLNFIIGFSDLMVNSPETYAPLKRWPPGLYDDIKEVYRSSNHLLALINDILEMGKIDAQQITLFKERLHVSDLVEEVRDMVEPAVINKKLWLQVDIQADLPAITVDRTRIRQVLLNLVTNALRFTDRGGITIRARLKDSQNLLVEVEDTGVGISPENLDKVFEEFRQVGSENWRRSEGTGLGLSIGRRFIQLHGGNIGVTSQVGKGSIFYFTLPLNSTDEDLDLSIETWPDGVQPLKAHQSASDSDHLVFILTSATFWARVFGQSLAGYQISDFSIPREMIAAVRQHYPRAVLIDKAMADDPEVCDFIQNPPYDLPIVTLHIPASSSTIEVQYEGVSRYLVKPVTRDVLVESIGSLGSSIHSLLVVDDDPSMVRYLMQTIASARSELPSRDYRFLTAYTGQQALDHLNSELVDAVLLDLDLPDMDGLSVLHIIQHDARFQNLPVIIISAQDPPGLFQQPISGSFEVLLNRSFTRTELQGILAALLEKVSPGYQRASAAAHRSAQPEPESSSTGQAELT